MNHRTCHTSQPGSRPSAAGPWPPSPPPRRRMPGGCSALIRRSMRLILGILLITLLIPVPRLDAAAGDDAEIRIGRDYARRLEARYKVVTEGDVSERGGGLRP